MITAPPNPHEDEARASRSAYVRPMLVNPPPPDLDAALARIAATWPDMLRYADTARIERLQHERGWCWGVTVTIFERSEL